MPDKLFDHPRLAAIYDVVEGERNDLDTYVAIVNELDAQRVLDVGCGTGCLAVRLARGDRTVVGVDPAGASLDAAKAKDGADEVTWIHGDATAVPAFDADLAVMTANVAQVFLADEDWAQTLRAIHGALRTGGHLVFETRRPERRAWEDWAADPAHAVFDVPGIGQVEQRREVTGVNLPFVSFRYSYRFLADGEVLVSDSTLRFRSYDEVRASLVDTGYHVLDVRDAPDRPGREYVFLAQRA